MSTFFWNDDNLPDNGKVNCNSALQVLMKEKASWTNNFTLGPPSMSRSSTLPSLLLPLTPHTPHCLCFLPISWSGDVFTRSGLNHTWPGAFHHWRSPRFSKGSLPVWRLGGHEAVRSVCSASNEPISLNTCWGLSWILTLRWGPFWCKPKSVYPGTKWRLMNIWNALNTQDRIHRSTLRSP